MADLTCHHGLRYGTCLDCGEHPERHTTSDETGPAARHADTLRTLNSARAIIREACAALGCEPSTLASTALEARQRVAALEAEVERLRRERDALRLACQMLITDGAALARQVERARALFAAFDGALLAWERRVAAERGAIDGAER